MANRHLYEPLDSIECLQTITNEDEKDEFEEHNSH